MDPDLPDTVTDQTVTPEWLNAKLGITTITSIDLRRIGEGQGFTDPIYRIHLTHAPDDHEHEHAQASSNSNSNGNNNGINPRPKTLILKAANGSLALPPQMRAREAFFYREMAPLLTHLGTIPHCYHVTFNEATCRGTLLLQDAGTPVHRAIGLYFDKATPAQARRAVVALGRFQGACLALKAKGEFPVEGIGAQFAPGTDMLRVELPVFTETWLPYLGMDAGTVLERFSRAVDAHEVKWAAVKASFFQGVLHGDYRLGNVLFCREASATAGGGGGEDEDGEGVMDCMISGAFGQALRASIAERDGADPQTGLAKASPDVGASAASTMSGSTRPATDDTAVDVGQHDSTNSSSPSQGHTSTDSDEPPTTLSIIDWQTLSHGPAVYDLAYFLATSMRAEARRESEFDLIHAWYTAFRDEAGPAWAEAAAEAGGFSMARCVREISAACIAIVLLNISVLSRFRAPEPLMRAMGRNMAVLSEMAVDWESLED